MAAARVALSRGQVALHSWHCALHAWARGAGWAALPHHDATPHPPWPCLPLSHIPPLQDFDQNEGPLFERVEQEVEAAREDARAAELKTGEAVQARRRDGVGQGLWRWEQGGAPAATRKWH